MYNAYSNRTCPTSRTPFQEVSLLMAIKVLRPSIFRARGHNSKPREMRSTAPSEPSLSRASTPCVPKSTSIEQKLRQLTRHKPLHAAVVERLLDQLLAECSLEREHAAKTDIRLLNRWIDTKPRQPRRPDLVLSLDTDLRYVDAQMLRPIPMVRPAEDMIGRRVSDVVPASLCHQFADAAQLALNGTETTIRYSLKLPTGLVISEARVHSPATSNVIIAEIIRLCAAFTVFNAAICF